ncbi:DnaB-like helicase N-terminal domain-containing protein [Nonomuraea sp. SYSU D8015]|uniref:DnaB-like helicase N-terminal domain-containing protein n=1 Tax=Nonomuraea sp. SYSU D8015 TaxID=2593644 RepID=UPI00166070F4|nr:DnaB-like helicase N-terminal domain-containing protein [Nonomuraea sp. SYSU D8015]
MTEPGVAAHSPTPHAPSSPHDIATLVQQAADQVAATWLDTRTEQALLGALLLQPEQLQEVKPWLRASDFFGAHHQLIFKTIDELITAQPTISFKQLAMDVYERLAPYGIDAPQLHTLMHVCPQPDHAVAYGHMVVQADARRAVARYTHRLAETIEVIKDGRGHLSEVLDAATNIGYLASQLKTRTLSHGEPTSVQTATPVSTPSPERIDQDDRLLTLLINCPNDIPEVATFLHRTDFATPFAGQLYDLLLSMHESGTPIDVLTVMWAGRRAQILDAGDVSSKDFFRRFDRIPLDVASVLAAEIQQAATLEHAATIAGTLTAALADHSVPTSQILHLAASQVDDLQRRHRRYSAAYQAPDDQASVRQTTQAASTI